MAIVSEDDVSAALQYLALDPHPVAIAKKDLTDAENEKREYFAAAFLKAEGSVDAKKAQAEIDEHYREAKDAEKVAILEYERHRSRIKAAEMLLDIYRTENANARAAERIR